MYSHARLDTDRILLGTPANYHLMALRELTLLPIDTLLTVDAESPHYTENNRATAFYAQSWALTHYLLMSDQAAHRPKLAAFLDALEVPSDGIIAALERSLTLNPDMARASALLGYVKASSTRDPRQGFDLVRRGSSSNPATADTT
jgi:hypothetical protein